MTPGVLALLRRSDDASLLQSASTYFGCGPVALQLAFRWIQHEARASGVLLRTDISVVVNIRWLCNCAWQGNIPPGPCCISEHAMKHSLQWHWAGAWMHPMLFVCLQLINFSSTLSVCQDVAPGRNRHCWPKHPFRCCTRQNAHVRWARSKRASRTASAAS